MLRAVALLLTLQLVGEALADAFAAPLPGPVIGMALLLAGLALAGGPSPTLDSASRGLLDNLGLLFVPAGVGVSLHLGRAAEEAWAIAAAVVVATLATVVATAWAFVALDRLARSTRGAPTSERRDG